jgi:hypothetical protein
MLQYCQIFLFLRIGKCFLAINFVFFPNTVRKHGITLVKIALDNLFLFFFFGKSFLVGLTLNNRKPTNCLKTWHVYKQIKYYIENPNFKQKVKELKIFTYLL